MSLTNLQCFITLDKSSSDAKQSFFLLFEMVDLLLFHRFFNWVRSMQSFFFRFWYFLLFSGSSEIREGKQNLDFNFSKQEISVKDDDDDGDGLRRGDVEMVMRNLGLFCSPESGEELEERFGSNELLGLFEEKEPSLWEVKEAFDVFDENRDGFIDAEELQRVFCNLGLMKHGSELEKCKKMIGSYDENGDGRIDLNEFVKIMENSFC
ncbi:probable calcium-binding protein CML45 [Carica papaya]|uniref:Calmodulin-like protein 46 n=1 Tax=Carica papaya TaxID=3649 RepID=A0A3S8V2K4_CARPA|nr:probable calcium-binding protein CML45 [Carica papaya]AZL94072.1 calmodulin-like protein 46 [Carica papaya]